jgi:hypothetical protein
MARPRI